MDIYCPTRNHSVRYIRFHPVACFHFYTHQRSLYARYDNIIAASCFYRSGGSSSPYCQAINLRYMDMGFVCDTCHILRSSQVYELYDALFTQ